MKLGLLNTSIITGYGQYNYQPLTVEDAAVMAQNSSTDSAIGHQSTADVMTELLGIDVPVNRQRFAQAVGQKAIVMKLNGRPPEGKILSRQEIEEIGYEMGLLTRTA